MGLKKRYRPFYKQLLKLRKNVQNRSKFLKFRKQKWGKFQQYSKDQLKFHKRLKVKDQLQLSVPRFASRGNSFQRKFKNDLYGRKLFNFFYGKLKRAYLKRRVIKFMVSKSSSSDFRYKILKFFESRLDIVLYRACFSQSIKGASQLILHGHVLVNGIHERTKSYVVKTNDSIKIAQNQKSRNLVKNNLDKCRFWPIPPKHLFVNYRTLQILFLYIDISDSMPILDHYLNINSVIASIKKY